MSRPSTIRAKKRASKKTVKKTAAKKTTPKASRQAGPGSYFIRFEVQATDGHSWRIGLDISGNISLDQVFRLLSAEGKKLCKRNRVVFKGIKNPFAVTQKTQSRTVFP